VGAVRVEVRGSRDGVAESVLVGSSGRPALLAGSVAATIALMARDKLLRPGAGGLASVVPAPGDVLAELSRRGARVMEFDGGRTAVEPRS
jgi:hypothetical protein